MQAKKNKRGKGAPDSDGEKSSRSASRFCNRCCGIAGVRSAIKNQQRNRGDNRHTRDVKQSLKHPNPENIRDGKFSAASQEKGTNGFPRAAEKKNGCKSRESGWINFPELRPSQIALKDLPTQSPQRVAAIDEDDAPTD